MLLKTKPVADIEAGHISPSRRILANLSKKNIRIRMVHDEPSPLPQYPTKGVLQ
jgi:hypothetical protein